MNPFPQPKCCLPEKLLSSEQQTHFVRLSVFEISRTKSSTTKWWKLVHSSTYQKLSDWPGRIRARAKACKRTDGGTFLKSVSWSDHKVLFKRWVTCCKKNFKRKLASCWESADDLRRSFKRNESRPAIVNIVVKCQIYQSSSRYFYNFIFPILSPTLVRKFLERCAQLAKRQSNTVAELNSECLLADEIGRRSE